MAKLTLTDGTVIEGTVEELTQYAEKAADMFKYQGDSGMPAEAPVETIEDLITHNGAEYKLVDRIAQAGDVVYVTKDAKGTKDIPNDAFYTVDKDGEIGDRWRHEVYRPRYNRTTDTVKVYEPVAKELTLKVGDYAKVVQKGHEQFGEIVKLSSFYSEYLPFNTTKLNGKEGDAFALGHLVRATDEEVAEAKAQAEKAAVEAKWASIGRKPNEFKKGDIVKVENPCGAPLKAGDLVEVESDSTRRISVKVTAVRWTVVVSELITPVESRFDHA